MIQRAIPAVIVSAMFFFGVAGCASTGAKPDAVTKTQAGASGLGALSEPAIPKEACGMILWTLDAQRPSPIFRYVSGDRAEIVLAGAPIALDLVNYSGAAGFGVFEHQVFSDGQGVIVEVTSRFGLGFDGGAYLEKGLVKVTGADGWSIVAPAAGIAGCRS